MSVIECKHYLPLVLRFRYVNHRGEVGERRVSIRHTVLWRGTSSCHGDEEQVFLRGHDLDKDAERDFAVKDIVPGSLTIEVTS